MLQTTTVFLISSATYFSCLNIFPFLPWAVACIWIFLYYLTLSWIFHNSLKSNFCDFPFKTAFWCFSLCDLVEQQWCKPSDKITWGGGIPISKKKIVQCNWLSVLTQLIRKAYSEILRTQLKKVFSVKGGVGGEAKERN